MKNNKIVDWIIRFIKGMFIGTGAILPGVSGGALAAVFGIYERMIEFLANLWKDFWKNVLFFIPFGLLDVWVSMSREAATSGIERQCHRRSAGLGEPGWKASDTTVGSGPGGYSCREAL